MHSCNSIFYAGTSLSCAGIQQWKSVSFHCWTTFNLVGKMRKIPHHPPTTNNDMCNVKDPPYPTPHWSSAVESWSDMSNEEDPPYLPLIRHQQLRVEVTWAKRRSHPMLPPISHQQLRVEVTWAMRRTHPMLPPMSHQQLRVEVTCNEEDPPYPIPHRSLYCSAGILRHRGFGYFFFFFFLFCCFNLVLLINFSYVFNPETDMFIIPSLPVNFSK